MSLHRRSSRSNPLRTPAMARTSPLGEALNRAMRGENTTASLRAPRYRLERAGWTSGAGWRAGRVLTPQVVQIKTPSWSYAATPATSPQAGFALVEIMLVIGVIAIGTAGVIATYRVVDNNRKVNNEVEHAQIIAQNIVSHSVAAGNFLPINQTSAIRENMFPKDMLNADGDPKSKWGGDVLLTSETINGRANWGAVLTFEGVPATACSKLVSEAAPGFYGVKVNDNVLRENYSPLNAGDLTAECNADSSARVQFIYAKHGGPGGGSTGPLVPCTVPSPSTEVVVDDACPTDQIGTITYRTDYTCPSPYGTAVDLPPVQLSSTCAPICVVPTPLTETQTRTGVQTSFCPAGQTGEIVRNRPEQRVRVSTATCPASPGYSGPVGEPQWTPFPEWDTLAWTAVGGAPWTIVSNTCGVACVAPPATSTPYSQTASCTNGQVTPGGQSTFTQTRIGTATPVCRSPTGMASPGVEEFTPWTPTAATACAPACVAPPAVSTPITRPLTPETQSLGCPTGQGGVITQERTRNENGRSTTSYSCPAPTGNYVTAPAALTWYGTFNYGVWQTTANTCAPTCVAPRNTTESESQADRCPTPLITPAGSPNFTQNRSRDITYICRSSTGSYETIVGNWSAWTPSSASICSPSCVSQAPAPFTETSNTPETQTIGCPNFQTGQITQTRIATKTRAISYTCPAPVGPSVPVVGEWSRDTYSEWTNTSSTCTPPTCDGTIPGNARNYLARYPDLATAFGNDYNAAYAHWYTSGYNEGRESCWGPPCVVPAPTTRWVAASDTSCPAGSSGTRTFEAEQQRDGVCSSPTAPPGYGSWRTTGQIRNVNTSQCRSIYAQCVVSAGTPQSRTWIGRGYSCTASFPAGSYAHGDYRTLNAPVGRTGSATYQCVNGAFNSTEEPGAICSR